MNDCENCIHKKVCDLWHEQERQDAGCFFLDDCELFESVRPLTAQERAELQFYRGSDLSREEAERALQEMEGKKDG